MKRLIGLVTGILLLAPVLAGAARADEPMAPQLDARIALHAYRALVEDELGDTLNGLKALAKTAEIQSADWERAKAPLTQFAKALVGHTVFLAEPDGTYYTTERGLIPQKLSDRAYFPRLLAGHDVAGDLVISRSTGKKAVVVAVPILREGHVVGAVGASIDLEMLSQWIDRDLQLPKSVVFFALDHEGRVALNRDATLIMKEAAKLGGESLAAAMAEMQAKPEGVVRYDFRDAHRVVVFEKSKHISWVFALGSVQP